MIMPPFFADFASHQRDLCGRLQEFVLTLPPALREAALAWSRARDIAEARLAWNSIYFFVPFWAQSELDRPITAECREVAYANACLTYAVLIQDELMDEQGAASGACALAANAFSLEAHLSYSSLFAPDSEFWFHFNRLQRQSWDHLLIEKRRQLDPGAALTDGDEELQTAKVNWMKAAAVAVALLNERPEVIPGLCGHIDAWQLACQKIDDLLDWRDDLREKNYTYLLAAAGATSQRKGERSMHAFFGSGAAASYLDRALHDYRVAESHCIKSDGPLASHLADLIDRLQFLRQTYGTFLAQARTVEYPSKPPSANRPSAASVQVPHPDP